MDMRDITDEQFKAFYRFYFLFNCEEKLLLDFVCIEDAFVMWALVFQANGPNLNNQRAPHLFDFVNFLSSTNVDRVTFKDWMTFLDFQIVKLDLSNYSDDGLNCSLLFRNYADWRKSETIPTNSIICNEISKR